MSRAAAVFLVLVLAAFAFVSPALGEATVLSSPAWETDTDTTYFVKFFAPWCGHCKRLAPIWHELADSLSSEEGVKIATMDCTANQEACKAQDIKGYPTLKIFQDGKMLKEYNGNRELNDLKLFVQDAIED